MVARTWLNPNGLLHQMRPSPRKQGERRAAPQPPFFISAWTAATTFVMAAFGSASSPFR